MKPVHTVQDIVRRKNFAKPSNTKALLKNIKNASVVASARIPFIVWFAALLVVGAVATILFIEAIPHPSVSQLSAAVQSKLITTTPKEMAIVQGVAESSISLSTSSATSSDKGRVIKSEAKPSSSPTLPIFPLKKNTATINVKTANIIAPNKNTAQTQINTPKLTPIIPSTITAASFMDATTLSTSERRDGPYKIVLTTNAGTYGTIVWDLNRTNLSIGAPAQNFSISYSCDPPPSMPDFDAFDQNPMFTVQAPYTCTIGLTPTSGSDRRIQSKQFSFTAGVGQLFITSQSSMYTVLQNNLNSGGFVFKNDDTDPVTVTGVDIDASYRGLDTTDNPLLMRFKNPVGETPLAEYDLASLTADASLSYSYSGTNIHIPLSFTINAGDQKLLPINILGVHRLSIYGVDPIVAITLRHVTIDKSANKIVIGTAKISWSCIVPAGAYDPNSTTGPYATGQACQQ